MTVFKIVGSFFWIRFPRKLSVQAVEEDGEEGESGELGLIEVPHLGNHRGRLSRITGQG